jgi:hypothetical protein
MVIITLKIFYYQTREHAEWPAFDWMHVDCFPDLIQLTCMLPQKEDSLRIRTTKVAFSCLELIH